MEQKVQPYQGKGTITKAELRDMYNLSRGTLRYLMNVRYYEQFKALGYYKYDKLIPPLVVEKFREIWGDAH